MKTVRTSRLEFKEFAGGLEVPEITFIPISALVGDNVVDRSNAMPWYAGSSLLEHLETVDIVPDALTEGFRFPVQLVVRPRSAEADLHDFRGYAGEVVGGMISVGDEVVVLPSGFTSRVTAIETADGPIDEAFPPMSVIVRIEDDLDIGRGDTIASPIAAPRVGQDISAMVCWMSENPLRPGAKLALKHTTRWVRALVSQLDFRLDVNTLNRDKDAADLSLNDIGRIELRTTAPLFFDEYRTNRTTGSFILVDEQTNITVAAGMILPEGA